MTTTINNAKDVYDSIISQATGTPFILQDLKILSEYSEGDTIYFYKNNKHFQIDPIKYELKQGDFSDFLATIKTENIDLRDEKFKTMKEDPQKYTDDKEFEHALIKAYIDTHLWCDTLPRDVSAAYNFAGGRVIPFEENDADVDNNLLYDIPADKIKTLNNRQTDSRVTSFKF